MVPATITSVSIHGVAVVVGGVDTRIPMRLLTFRYLLDARTAYHVGQELLVYVNKIETLPNGRHEIEVSAKQAELQSARMRQKLLPRRNFNLGRYYFSSPCTLASRYPCRNAEYYSVFEDV